MRQFLIYLGLLVLGAVGAAAVVAAAPDPAVTIAPQQTQTATVSPAVAAPIQIVPHRAIYTMSLASVKNGGNISDVSGKMLFEWRDVCDGWAIQQHMQLHFTYSDGGDDQDVISTELTYESKDGKNYTFAIRRLTNGQETENYRGKAKQNPDTTVLVDYSTPEGKKLTLPAGTLFPSAHTEMVLANALKGQKFFSRRVFDGSDEDGSSDISAFISPQRAVALDTSLDAKMKQSPLLTDAAWPIHMAFFTIGSETGAPDYEMDLTLLPNGVARHMKIDYGDFSVTGTLAQLEALPPQTCQ